MARNTTVKSKHFTAVYSGEDITKNSTEPWKVYRKKDTAAGSGPVFTAECGVPDAYKCAKITFSSAGELSSDEYVEIFETLINVFTAYSTAVFYRLARADAESIPQTALEKLRFAEDPADAAFLLRESQLTDWAVVYMLFGLSVGMSCGMSVGQTPGMFIGMAAGSAVGFLLGTGITKSRKTAREELKAARMSGEVLSDEE